jgi:hypothetical protein
MFFIIMLGFASQIGNPQINLYGHLGGLISGFLILPLIVKPHNADDGVCCNYQTWFIVCACLTAVQFITCILCFYLMDKYV